MRHKNGFTIVELLIVIVVIGILATIAIVAYNGVREKAVDAKRAAAIDQYVKILTIYKMQGGVFPEDNFCIGDEKDYPQTDDFAQGECVQATGTTIRVNPEFNNKLKEVSNAIPDPTGSSIILNDGDGYLKFRGMIASSGALYYYDTEKGGLTCPKAAAYYADEESFGVKVMVCAVSF